MLHGKLLVRVEVYEGRRRWWLGLRDGDFFWIELIVEYRTVLNMVALMVRISFRLFLIQWCSA